MFQVHLEGEASAYGMNGIAHSVAATGDGGYFVGGETDLPGSGGHQALVFKLDAAGNLEWQKTFNVAAPHDFVARSVLSSAEGGHVVAGSSRGFGDASDQAWIMKLDSSGSIPGCAHLETATATWSASGAFVTNSTDVATATSAPAVSGTATAVDTNAVPQARCYYRGAVVTDVPTLSQWATIGRAVVLAFGGAVILGRSRNASPPAGSCRNAQRSHMAARSEAR